MVCIVVAMFGFGSDLASGVGEPVIGNHHQLVQHFGLNVYLLRPWTSENIRVRVFKLLL